MFQNSETKEVEKAVFLGMEHEEVKERRYGDKDNNITDNCRIVREFISNK